MENKLINAIQLANVPVVYLASIMEKHDNLWIQFCAAYYVGTNCFLTASICIEEIKNKTGRDSSKVRIYLGSQFLLKRKIYKLIRYEKFENYIYRHQTYNSRSVPNYDVGLMKVIEIFHYDCHLISGKFLL